MDGPDGLGLQFGKPYQGTMFRFPVRTLINGKESPIVDRLADRVHYDAERLHHMFDSFTQLSHRVLLFLRNVVQVNFYLYPAHGKLTKLAGVSVPDLQRKALVEARSRRAPASAWTALPHVEFKMTVQVVDYARDTVRESDWLILSATLNGEDPELEELAKAQRARPTASVAVDLAALGSSNELDGGIYATLPLPIATGLCVQLNSAWALPANRRTLWFSAKRDVRTHWNAALATRLLAPLYVLLLASARRILSSKSLGRERKQDEDAAAFGDPAVEVLVRRLSRYNALWPTPNFAANPLLPEFTTEVFRLAYGSPEPLFEVYDPLGGEQKKFSRGTGSLFIPTHEEVPNMAAVLPILTRLFAVASTCPGISWRPCHMQDTRPCVASCACKPRKPCSCSCRCTLPGSLVLLPPVVAKLLVEALSTQGCGGGSKNLTTAWLTPQLLASALRAGDFWNCCSVHENMDGLLYQETEVSKLLAYLAPTSDAARVNLPGVSLGLTITGVHRKFGEEPLAFCSSDEELEVIGVSRALVLSKCVQSCHALSDPATAAKLKLLPVSPLTLGSTFLQLMLPKSWQNAQAIVWAEEKDPKTPSAEWLRVFWKYTQMKMSRSPFLLS